MEEVKEEPKHKSNITQKVKTAEETLETFMATWREEDWAAMNAISVDTTADEIQKGYERFVFNSYSIFNTKSTDTKQTISMRVNLIIKTPQYKINGRQMSIRLVKQQRKWYVIPASLFEQ